VNPAPCDDGAVSVLSRVAIFAVISVFTLGLGGLALLDGIEILLQAGGRTGDERTAPLGLGALTTAGALVPIAIWFIAGWALFVRRQRWEW
jgi:hypothetical protein